MAKTKTLSLRISSEDYELLVKEAEKNGQDESDFVRSVLNRYTGGRFSGHVNAHGGARKNAGRKPMPREPRTA